MARVKPIPDGYPQVTPYLCIDGAAAAIQFYERIFGAKERMRMPSPDGKVAHAELQIGDSVIMMSDEYPEMGVRNPRAVGGISVTLMIYVEDVDSVLADAVNAGAKIVQPAQDQFYGDRAGVLEDPFGHRWHVASHIEDVSPDEMAKRATKAMAGK